MAGDACTALRGERRYARSPVMRARCAFLADGLFSFFSFFDF
jgi:hypothetical protein